MTSQTQWVELPIKRLFIDRKGGAWGEEPDTDNSIVCIRAADFITEKIRHSTTELTRRKFDERELRTRSLQTGDLIIEKSGGGEQQPVGRVVSFELDEIALCSNFLELLRPNQKITYPRYAAYLLYSLWLQRANFPFIKQTTGIQNLDIEEYFYQTVSIPPLPEQYAIADYLDRETARLDSLIAAKERLLESLAEKRAATINQFVTNGNAINNVQKDKSPAPWLFPLPSGWKRQPLKHISFTKGRIGYEELKAEEYTDEGPYLVSSAHFRDEKVEWERCNHVTRERFEMAPDIILRQHDVLFMKDGAAMGKLAYIDELPGDACLNSHILVIRPLQENYLPKFLFYVLMTDVFKAYMEQERKGTTFFGFSEQSMGNFPMSFPSLSEQKEIVSSLEDKIEKIDRLAELANKTIEHLHERRASLIAAAVSGQVKVY